MVMLPVTLPTTGALALINFWLAVRISLIRHPQRIDVGHGGILALERRMRAQANFAEYVPLTVVLLALVEFAGGTSWPLALLAAILVLARVAHPFGMDGWAPGRVIGTIGTWAAMVALALWAIVLAARVL